MHVSERTFQYLQKLDGFFEVSEQEMIYWTQWLTHLLKTTCEPTSAVAMGAVAQWLKTQTTPRKVLVIISGGNIAPDTYQTIWKENYLTTPPDQR
jgi:threonine dehydratase